MSNHFRLFGFPNRRHCDHKSAMMGGARSCAPVRASIQKRERWPSETFQESAVGPDARQHPNAEHDTEQKPCEVFGSTLARHGSLGLCFANCSYEERLELGDPIGNQDAQPFVMRRDFERRVNEKAAAPFPV